MNKIRKLKINYIKQIFCMFWKTCSLGAYSVGITTETVTESHTNHLLITYYLKEVERGKLKVERGKGKGES